MLNVIGNWSIEILLQPILKIQINSITMEGEIIKNKRLRIKSEGKEERVNESTY